VSLEEETRVVEALGQAEALLAQLVRRFELLPDFIKHPESMQDQVELWRLA